MPSDSDGECLKEVNSDEIATVPVRPELEDQQTKSDGKPTFAKPGDMNKGDIIKKGTQY